MFELLMRRYDSICTNSSVGSSGKKRKNNDPFLTRQEPYKICASTILLLLRPGIQNKKRIQTTAETLPEIASPGTHF